MPILFWALPLLSGTTKCSWLILYFPCFSSRIIHFFKQHWFLLLERDSETKICLLDVLNAIAVSLLQGFLLLKVFIMNRVEFFHLFLHLLRWSVDFSFKAVIWWITLFLNIKPTLISWINPTLIHLLSFLYIAGFVLLTIFTLCLWRLSVVVFPWNVFASFSVRVILAPLKWVLSVCWKSLCRLGVFPP